MNLAILEDENNLRGFYPTPDILVSEMLNKADWGGVKYVLEPSAGRGDIAEQARALLYQSDKENIDCIEIDANLRHVLKGKSFRVVHDDFLSFTCFKKYDLIVMNPPFFDGDKHLLKALEIVKNGGQVVCLLNAETLLKPYMNTRKVLASQLKAYGADIVFKTGDFKEAERPTAVNIALVYVKIPEVQRESDIYINMKKAYDAAHGFDSSAENSRAITFAGMAERLVRDFEIEAQATLEFINSYNALAKHIGASSSVRYPIITLGLSDGGSFSSNGYLRIVRKKYWHLLLDKPEIMGMLTSNLQDKYWNMLEGLSDYDFNLFNIKEVGFSMQKELTSGVQDVVLDLFDKLSREHAWLDGSENNILHFNGWKTNKAHMVNTKKVIIPTYGMFSTYSWEKARFKSSVAYKVIRDLEKAFDYLDAEGVGRIVDLKHVVDVAEANGCTKNLQCKYFKVDLYKKGTMHIKFNEEARHLVDKLNIYAAQNRGWLPPTYGKKSYSEMDQEERSVVNEFQGEKKYKEVMEKRERYIYQPANIVLF